jgi:tetratricopeptide (TPR) repeat protein
MADADVLVSVVRVCILGLPRVQAIAIKNDWEKGWYRRGVALSNLQRYEDAMIAFQKCLDLNSSSKDYQQQFDQAKKDLFKGLSESEIFKMDGNEVRARSERREGGGWKEARYSRVRHR